MKKLMALTVILLSILIIVSAVACGSKSSSVTYCDSYHACPTDQVGDGYCDEGCNTAECNYDNGDCHLCASGCTNAWLGDGYCNPECNTYACNYDDGDCSSPTATYAGAACPCVNQQYPSSAQDCVAQYLLHDAATTYNGRQLQATLADAFEYSGMVENEQIHYADGRWEINFHFHPYGIEQFPELADILTVLSTHNQEEVYNTRWEINPEGCIEATNGNAIRLLTELQN